MGEDRWVRKRCLDCSRTSSGPQVAHRWYRFGCEVIWIERERGASPSFVCLFICLCLSVCLSVSCFMQNLRSSAHLHSVRLSPQAVFTLRCVSVFSPHAIFTLRCVSVFSPQAVFTLRCVSVFSPQAVFTLRCVSVFSPQAVFTLRCVCVPRHSVTGGSESFVEF
jgi:hypothetical protein